MGVGSVVCPLRGSGGRRSVRGQRLAGSVWEARQGSRSASIPVRALTSAVLPWSICPAVPTRNRRMGKGYTNGMLLLCHPERSDLSSEASAKEEGSALLNGQILRRCAPQDDSWRRRGVPERRCLRLRGAGSARGDLPSPDRRPRRGRSLHLSGRARSAENLPARPRELLPRPGVSRSTALRVDRRPAGSSPGRGPRSSGLKALPRAPQRPRHCRAKRYRARALGDPSLRPARPHSETSRIAACPVRSSRRPSRGGQRAAARPRRPGRAQVEGPRSNSARSIGWNRTRSPGSKRAGGSLRGSKSRTGARPIRLHPPGVSSG